MPKTIMIGVGTDRPIGRPIYVTDLPGHDGLKKSATNPKSDWGWGKRENAIALTPYWQRRFQAYCNRGCGFRGKLVEVSVDSQTE
jgi:hypothetical protein